MQFKNAILFYKEVFKICPDEPQVVNVHLEHEKSFPFLVYCDTGRLKANN